MRFSAIHQGQGSSIERQSELTSKWLFNHPEYELSKLSQKDLGKSGFKGTHLDHGLGTILSAIQGGKIKAGDVLLIEAFDRLGRLEPLEMVSLVTGIVTAGIDIHTLQDNAVYDLKRLNENSGALFILVGKVQAAHDYSKQLSTRLTASYESRRLKAKQGLPIKAPRPFWIGKDNKLNENADAVRACLDLYLKGQGARSILNDLYKDYPVLESVNPNTINRWWKNAAIYGAWGNKAASEPIEGVFEPLITKAEYYNLQAVLKSRRKKASVATTYPLAGIFKCTCGANFQIRRKEYKGEVILYCNCRNYLMKGHRLCDNNQTWPYEVLEVIFNSSGYENTLTDHAMDRGDESLGESVAALEEEIYAKDEQINKLIDALITVPDSAGLKNRLKQLESDKAELESQKSKVLNNTDSLSDELISAMDKELAKIGDDKEAIKRVLVNRGFSIVLDGKTTTVPHDTTKMTITLKRSLAKYRAYLVECSHPEYEIIDAADEDSTYKFEADKWYLVINRKDGIIASGDTYLDVVDQLKERA
jgi:DNA invertase Pin-like site-specific DNA recombinase